VCSRVDRARVGGRYGVVATVAWLVLADHATDNVTADDAPDAVRRPVGLIRRPDGGHTKLAGQGGAMIASVHLADVGVPTAFAITRKAPPAGSVAGLRHADVALAARARSFRRRNSAGLASSRSGTATTHSTTFSSTIRSRPNLRRAGTFGSRRCAPTAPGRACLVTPRSHETSTSRVPSRPSRSGVRERVN
jgi:hypothetical protein